jgi:hypothetical protein
MPQLTQHILHINEWNHNVYFTCVISPFYCNDANDNFINPSWEEKKLSFVDT